MVGDWLQSALDKGEGMTLDDVKEELAEGRAMLWQGEKSAVVVELKGQVLHFWLAGGDLDEILSIRVGVEAFGRAHGYQLITLMGRKGWARRLRPHGYTPRDGYLVKELQCF